MNDLVSVLDVDAGLAELVPQDRRAEARRATAAATLGIAAGPWREAKNPDRARGGFGLLLVEGAMIRRVGIDGRFGAELLGPGDLLRPWQREGNVLGIEWSWRALTHARLAVLDTRWAARAAPWPQLGAELAGRALARSVRAVVAMAITQQPKLEERLWMLFWELAERYGRVHRRRRPPRSAADPRGAEPPRRRAPAFGVRRADAAGERRAPAPRRPLVGPPGRAAGRRELRRLVQEDRDLLDRGALGDALLLARLAEVEQADRRLVGGQRDGGASGGGVEHGHERQ